MTDGGAIGALGDITVLELCDEKGQWVGKLLADMGARVIKVEPPGGDGARRVGPFKGDVPHPDRSLYFWQHNTSKQGITLDIRTGAGQEVLRRLVERADILLESFAPGYLDSLGLRYESLSRVNPRLIMTSLTGFGQTGPYRDYKTSDLVALALGGQMASCGYDDVPGAPPIRPDGGHGYYIGSHYGVIGTLVALVFRDLTGQGQHIDASIHEACAGTTEAAVPWYIYRHQVPCRQTGRHHAVVPTPRTQYPTADGRLVSIFAVTRDLSTWLRMVAWMEERGMAQDLRDEKYRQAVVQGLRSGPEVEHMFRVMGQFFASLPAEEVYHDAQRIGFPWAIVRSPEETLEDRHLRDRGFFVEVEHPELGERYTYTGAPYIFSKTPWQCQRAPLLGEHNAQVYGELGFTAEEMVALRESGVI
ncbi:MAG: CoA transferase [Chloroflexi bacterium]|nr:CoA transferase [Chloroflexota bacterium]